MACKLSPFFLRFARQARFLNFLGFKLPFDRHDWVVDRCGTDVRYIIDFYNGAFSFFYPCIIFDHFDCSCSAHQSSTFSMVLS